MAVSTRRTSQAGSRLSGVSNMILMLALVVTASCTGHAWAADVDHEATAEAMDQGRITADIQAFEALGSRVSGYEGNARAADMILQRFKDLGLETMVQEFDLPSPVDLGSTLTIGDRSYELSALWPNHARTCQVPAAGLRGP
ncbi:MAG: hypothetical protein KKI08_15655, partial [Armatimonadetes bacterium]|nr:hypothetical protein [Armatimonadota bacterium]